MTITVLGSVDRPPSLPSLPLPTLRLWTDALVSRDVRRAGHGRPAVLRSCTEQLARASDERGVVGSERRGRVMTTAWRRHQFGDLGELRCSKWIIPRRRFVLLSVHWGGSAVCLPPCRTSGVFNCRRFSALAEVQSVTRLLSGRPRSYRLPHFHRPQLAVRTSAAHGHRARAVTAAVTVAVAGSGSAAGGRRPG